MPMWVYDVESLRFLAVNEAAVQLYGYTEAEFLHMNLRDIRPEEDVPELLENLKQIRQGKAGNTNKVWRHRHKDGSLVLVTISASDYTFGGQPARLALVRDVTDEITARKPLELQKLLFQKTARDTASQAVFGELCAGFEQILPPATFCAVMQPDEARQHLHLAAANGLPAPLRYHLSLVAMQTPLMASVEAFGTGQRSLHVADTDSITDRLIREAGLLWHWAVPVWSADGAVAATLDFYGPLADGPGALEKICADVGSAVVGGVVDRDESKRQLARLFYDTLETRRAAEEERQRSLEHLERSERRFRTLAENSPDIIYVIRLPEWKIVYVNRKEILGHPVEMFTTPEGRDRIVVPDDVSLLQRMRQKATDDQSVSHRTELRVYNSVGQIEWFSMRTTVLSHYANGSVDQMLVTITVITEQKRIQESLAKEKANLKALVENTDDAIWSVNQRFEVIILNATTQQAFALLYGKDLQIGDVILDKIPPDEAALWQALYEKAFAGERFRREFHFNQANQDFYFDISFSAIFNERGEAVGASVFARNITEKKLAENQLVKANFELDSFVYRASHDLRAPLRSVLGLLNLVQNEQDADTRVHYLALAEKSINRLDTFINDLTNFSRNSRTALQNSEVDFTVIIDECAENLRFMENALRVELRRRLHIGESFHSDSARIAIILQNLLSNAVKYQRLNEPSPYVSVDIRTDARQACIVVSDNGIGIAQKHLPRLFEMFFRASASSYGSGLGLYITKQVVEKLGGTISVESGMELGTTFTIVLPNRAAN
jgi:PAS domain S-box-containing protein